MDYGRDDERGWTVRRPDRVDGSLSTLLGHAVPVVVGAVAGVVIGLLFPLVVANWPSKSAYQREMDRQVGVRSIGERAFDEAIEHEGERLESGVRRAALDSAAAGTAKDARRRALIGAVLGALAGAGVVFASRKKR